MQDRGVLGRATCALWIGLAAGCGNESTDYPPGLEPLEDNTAPDPAADGELALAPGETDDYAFVHGRGRVGAPAAAVWEAVKDPEVVVGWRQVDAYAVTPVDDTDYELEFELHYEVEELITVEWDEDWRYGTIEGVPEAPELALVRYQKVFGSTFIELIEGSIAIAPVDDATTEIAFVEHVKAVQGGTEEITTSMNDRFASVLARVRGEPLPR